MPKFANNIELEGGATIKNFQFEQVTSLPVTNLYQGRIVQSSDSIYRYVPSSVLNLDPVTGWQMIISDLSSDEIPAGQNFTAANLNSVRQLFFDMDVLSSGLNLIKRFNPLDISISVNPDAGKVQDYAFYAMSFRGLQNYYIINTGVPKTLTVMNINGGNQYQITNLKDGDILMNKVLPNGDFTYHVISSATKITKYTSNGTWTKPNPCVMVEIICIGGGGGGASGRKSATSVVAAGGGGGGGGGYTSEKIQASILPASVAITVGVLGAGGAPQTANSTDGLNGTTGGTSSFGSFLLALGGQGGIRGQSSGNAAGGGGGVGTYQGGAGGGSNTSTGTIGSNGAVGIGLIPSGGGSGGSITLGNLAQAGGAGGGKNGVNIAGGTAGASSGVAGGNGVTNTLGYAGTGGGGGFSNLTGNAGNGGNAGSYGGGGGGGGAARDSAGNSGKGGDGAGGGVIVIEYY